MIDLLHARPSRSLAWFASAGACALLAGAVLFWVSLTPVPMLRRELQVLQFWSLEACVFLGLAVAAAVLSELTQTLVRRDVVAALACGALALCLALALPPRMHRIFYDEQIYQNVGRNLADAKLAQLCNDGAIRNGRLRCAAAEYNKQPYAFPHLLSLGYRAFGVRDAIPFAVNAAAAGIGAACIYLLVLVLFANRIAAMFAAVLFGATPEQLVWSSSAAVEPAAAVACVAALLAAACFIRLRSDAALAGAAIAAAYAIQFRPESLLIVPIIVLLLWQRAPDEFARPRMLWAAALFLALAAVHIGHLAAVRNEGWGTTHERMSFAYAVQNLRVNGWFFLHDVRFPVAYTLLAFAGAFQRLRPGRSPFVVYFGTFFVITLFFYAGSYDYGADVRYSLATYPPIAVLAGLGAARLVQWARSRMSTGVACALLTGAVAGEFMWIHLPVVRSREDTAGAARADVAYARAFAWNLPPDAYVLTHNPGMFHVWGVNAGQMSLATSRGTVEALERRFPGGVYLHWNYWCTTDDLTQRALCERVRDLAPSDRIGEQRPGSQFFSFYRFKVTPIGAPPP